MQVPISMQTLAELNVPKGSLVETGSGMIIITVETHSHLY